MTPEELASGIEELIINASSEFGLQVESVQNTLYSKLSNKLKELETDPEGNITQSANNRNIIFESELIVKDVLSSGKYLNSVNAQLSNINKINELNSAYFKSIKDSFSGGKNFIKSIQSNAVKTVEDYLLKDGLAAQVRLPITNILNQNINSGGSFSGMLEQLRTFIKGDEGLDGRLLSYSRGILRDALFTYSRAYQASVTSDLGLEFYLYSGGIIDTTRPFCMERVGKYYHYIEIEAWSEEDWKGKASGTTKSSIFILAGGFNCTHSIVPVSERIVPKDVIDRNIDSGNYVP